MKLHETPIAQIHANPNDANEEDDGTDYYESDQDYEDFE